MSRVEIILSEPAQTNAYKALLKLDNNLLRSEFHGPTFTNSDVAVMDGFVIVVPQDGSGNRYFYPAHTVARVKEVEEAV